MLINNLLGVVIFLGNITVTGWWKLMADRTGDSKIISFAQRQVTLTDYVVTTGGGMTVHSTRSGSSLSISGPKLKATRSGLREW